MIRKRLVRRVRRLVERLLTNDDALLADPDADVVAVPAQPISSIQARELAHVRGEIVSIYPSPPGQPLDCQVDVFDGTGHVRLIWMGRQRIPGVDVGTTVRVSGRVAALNQRLVIYNPAYTIEAREDD